MARQNRRSATTAALTLLTLLLTLSGCEEKTSQFFAPQSSDSVPPGNVMGTVTVDGEPQSGVTVTLDEETETTTDAEGMYTFDPVTPGSHTVAVTPPEGTECDPQSQTVEVPAGGTATADFSCTTSMESFSISLDGDYRHNDAGSNPPSVVCGKISTEPSQPGASFEVTVTGSGVTGSGTVTGTLDDTGMATFEVGIDSFGEYDIDAEVNSDGTTATTSTTVNVTSSQSSCPS